MGILIRRDRPNITGSRSGSGFQTEIWMRKHHQPFVRGNIACGVEVYTARTRPNDGLTMVDALWKEFGWAPQPGTHYARLVIIEYDAVR